MRMQIKSVRDLRILFRNLFIKRNSISYSILSLLFMQSIDKKHIIMIINKPYIPLILNRLAKNGLVSRKDNYYYLTKIGMYLALSIRLDLSLLQLSIISIVYHYYDTSKRRFNSPFPTAVSDITKILTLLNTSRNERYIKQQISELVKRDICKRVSNELVLLRDEYYDYILDNGYSLIIDELYNYLLEAFRDASINIIKE